MEKAREDFSHAHFVCLMCKIIPSATSSDGSSIGSYGSREKQVTELNTNKTVKEIYLVRIMLLDVFGFAEHQKNIKCRLGYTLTITTNNDNAVVNRYVATALVNFLMTGYKWYVRDIIYLNVEQRALVPVQSFSEEPTELQ